jgi:hypothetical protein
MCQYMCLEGDGMPHDWHLVNAGTYAAGGAGGVVVEATGISPEARITAECAGIWNDEQRDSWSRVVDFVHSRGSGTHPAGTCRTKGLRLSRVHHAGRSHQTRSRGWLDDRGAIIDPFHGDGRSYRTGCGRHHQSSR